MGYLKFWNLSWWLRFSLCNCLF